MSPDNNHTNTGPYKVKCTVTSRNTKAVSLSDFQVDVKCFADCRYSQCPDRDLVDSYSTGLRAVMDHHAPLVHGHPLRQPPTLSPVVD